MNKKHQNGFSLIELLVVMLLISVFAVGMTLAINPAGSSQKQLNAAGEKLFAQMLYAQDEALVRGEALGIVFNRTDSNLHLANNYEWQRNAFTVNDRENKTNSRKWLKTSEPLGRHEIDKNYLWSLKVEDVSIEENLDRLLNENDEPMPLVVFYPSGEMSEFTITLVWSDEALKDNAEMASQRYNITVDERGELLRYRVGTLEQ
jgi:type II secretion system protein H